MLGAGGEEEAERESEDGVNGLQEIEAASDLALQLNWEEEGEGILSGLPW